MRSLLRIIDTTVTAGAIVGAILLAVAVHIGGWHVTRVLSPSMEPAYAPGDLVVVRTIDSRDLSIGDIPMLSDLTDPGARFVHRAISVTHRDRETDVVTQGDANPVSDTPVTITAAEVHVVAFVIPLSRLSQEVLVRTVGLLLLGGAVVTLISRGIRSRVGHRPRPIDTRRRRRAREGVPAR